MSGKTVPFSARISIEDAEFISMLEYDGAHTPSDKLRALLAETRRRNQNSVDYGENLGHMQEWFGQMKKKLLIRQQQLNLHNEGTLRLLDSLPDLIATLQTLTARASQLNVRELQDSEIQLLQKILRLNELLLPLALTSQKNAVSDSLFALAELISSYRAAIEGEPL